MKNRINSEIPIELFKTEIQNFFHQFIQGKIKSQRKISLWYEDVGKKIFDSYNRGKFFRGSLAIFSHDIFEGKYHSDIIKVGAAIELFETSILIHDDVIDRDLSRRGIPSIHQLYSKVGQEISVKDKFHFGDSLAICAGDLGLFWVFEILNQLDIDNGIKSSILTKTILEMTKVIVGEMDDISISENSEIPADDDVTRCYTNKTSSYTFVWPLITGAIMAGQSDEILKQLEDIGNLFGLIYQITDDRIGIFGDELVTGKSNKSDITEGKKTLYYCLLHKAVSNSEWNKLALVFGNKLASKEEIDLIKTKIIDTGVAAEIDLLLQKKADQTEIRINGLPISVQSKTAWIKFLKFIRNRDK